MRGSIAAVQIAPFVACAVMVPWYGWIAAFKPNVGLPAFAAQRREDLLRFLAAPVGLTVLSLILWPRWPMIWVEAAKTGTANRPLVMEWGGALLLIFIVLHILHFTTGNIRPAGTFIEGDVYANVTASFHIWWVVLFYVIAMIALGAHIYHGAWSSVRTVGVAQRAENPLKRRVALVLALFLWLGFTAVPVAIFLGIIG